VSIWTGLSPSFFAELTLIVSGLCKILELEKYFLHVLIYLRGLCPVYAWEDLGIFGHLSIMGDQDKKMFAILQPASIGPHEGGSALSRLGFGPHQGELRINIS
jgi:hypothetical protein